MTSRKDLHQGRRDNPEPRAERVQVDVCSPGMPCLTAGCTAPARVSVQLDEQPSFDYCGPDARNWIATHQRLDVEIVISDEAKRLLAEVTP